MIVIFAVSILVVLGHQIAFGATSDGTVNSFQKISDIKDNLVGALDMGNHFVRN